jgi:hypothetical protein
MVGSPRRKPASSQLLSPPPRGSKKVRPHQSPVSLIPIQVPTGVPVVAVVLYRRVSYWLGTHPGERTELQWLGPLPAYGSAVLEFHGREPSAKTGLLPGAFSSPPGITKVRPQQSPVSLIPIQVPTGDRLLQEVVRRHPEGGEHLVQGRRKATSGLLRRLGFLGRRFCRGVASLILGPGRRCPGPPRASREGPSRASEPSGPHRASRVGRPSAEKPGRVRRCRLVWTGGVWGHPERAETGHPERASRACHTERAE